MLPEGGVEPPRESPSQDFKSCAFLLTERVTQTRGVERRVKPDPVDDASASGKEYLHPTAICVCAGRDDKPQVFKLPLEHFLTYLYVEAVCLKELFRFRQEKTEVIHNKWGCEQ